MERISHVIFAVIFVLFNSSAILAEEERNPCSSSEVRRLAGQVPVDCRDPSRIEGVLQSLQEAADICGDGEANNLATLRQYQAACLELAGEERRCEAIPLYQEALEGFSPEDLVRVVAEDMFLREYLQGRIQALEEECVTSPEPVEEEEPIPPPVQFSGTPPYLPTPPPSHTRFWPAGWGLLGIGLAGMVGVGIPSWIAEYVRFQEDPSHLSWRQDLGDASFFIGLGIAAVGAILLIVETYRLRRSARASPHAEGEDSSSNWEPLAIASPLFLTF